MNAILNKISAYLVSYTQGSLFTLQNKSNNMAHSDNDNHKFRRNNLDRSSSPYLKQHLDNPVWWQEWSSAVIDYAKVTGKPLFVSVGYSTCHWCHVMASEAFSDERTAKYLNDNFICIKVDREQRPDIDQYLMEFIQKQTGRGGWPLNVFLTPSLNPVFALTYAPAYQKDSMNSFLSIVQQVYTYYRKHSLDIQSFIPVAEKPDVSEELNLTETLYSYFDREDGGFGRGQKFPSHTTLLFMLYQLSAGNDQSIREMCSKTLEAIRMRGLNDHLQGGIFRYCVDARWTIPHFEKMLYDQAMALWIYSLAYRVLDNPSYKAMAENILRCLMESFEEDGYFITAHDADTGHEEGSTYVWSFEELKEALSEKEFSDFTETYYITGEGNFEGSNHLIRRNDEVVKDIEEKLLILRKARKQPSRDDKILCGINSLTAIALIQAARSLGRPDLEIEAGRLVRRVIERFWDGTILAHSYSDNVLQKQGFLTDAAALFTAVTMLYEGDQKWLPDMNTFEKYLSSFREGDAWIESSIDDFRTVHASWFDHPVPSGAGLAEMGRIRAAVLRGQDIPAREYLQPYQSDFYNITSLICNGRFHIVTSHKAIDWHDLPVNSIQLRGEPEQDCYMGTCRLIDKGRLPG